MVCAGVEVGVGSEVMVGFACPSSRLMKTTLRPLVIGREA
jgi:hypothetical protein